MGTNKTTKFDFSMVVASLDGRVVHDSELLHVLLHSSDVNWKVVEDRWGISDLDDIDVSFSGSYSTNTDNTYELESCDMKVYEDDPEKEEAIIAKLQKHVVEWIISSFGYFEIDENEDKVVGIDNIVIYVNDILDRAQQFRSDIPHEQ